MFQSFTTETTSPVSNSESINELKLSRYSWKTLTKAGLVFVTTTGAFCALKATGSFSLISSWLKNKRINFDEQEARLAVHGETKEAEGIQVYPEYSELKESPLTIKDSHEHVTFMPQKAKRSSTETLEKIGPEFRVNTYTTGSQGSPSIASLSDGKFVVAWMSNGQDGSDYGVYGQMYNADGSKYSSEFRVNTYTTNDQSDPSVAGLSDGKFVVTWHSDGQDGSDYGIYGQMYNADGSKYSSEFRVNTYTTNDQSDPSVAGLSDGKFVVTWESWFQDGDIYAQIFSSNGSKCNSEFQVNTYTSNNQENPSIAGLSDGKFVVTWASWYQDGDRDGIYAQMFNSNGSKYNSEFRVNTYTTVEQSNPFVSKLSDDKFVVTWQSNGQDGNSVGIYGQIFNTDGTKFFSEFQVNTHTVDNQEYPCVASLSDNKFVVTWASYGQDGDSYGIYGQIFSYLNSSFPSEKSSLSASESFLSKQSGRSQQLSDSETAGTNSIGTIVGVIMGILSAALCGIGGGISYWYYRKNKDNKQNEIDLEKIPSADRISMMDETGKVKMSVVIPYERLKLEKKIGGGGSGLVYKGRWQNTDVAIKQLFSVEFDPRSKLEFIRETSIMATLRHPNIVAFFGVCLEPECCIVMEYMSEGSLYNLLHSNKELTWLARCHIALDVGRGLAFLHEKDVIHRDLKSLNVLLNKKGQAKLADFGLSKVKDASSATKGVKGTLRWMAPELFEEELGTEIGYTKKADVYSYGVIMYEIASQNDPFDEIKIEGKVIQKVLNGERPEKPKDCPGVYQTLLNRCWAQRANERPEMNVVVDTLDNMGQEIQILKC
jgi:predicted Ser/Thr protein kinase